MNREKIIIIDIDGTVLDSSYSIKYLNGEIETSNYATYFRTLDKVQPKNDIIDIICNLATKEKANLLFVTSRNCDKFACFHTMDFIERYFLPRVGNLLINVLFRALGDERRPVDMKLDKIKTLRSKYDIIALFEDDPEIIDGYSKEGLNNIYSTNQ